MAPIYSKAMPVTLTTPADVEIWLTVEFGDAVALQRPLPDDALRIVAKVERQDGQPRRLKDTKVFPGGQHPPLPQLTPSLLTLLIRC